MKLLYGTGNPAKLSAMKSRLESLDIELISLNDLRAEGKTIPEVPENGNTPLENARQNVYCILKIPTIAEVNPKSCMRIFPIIADVLVFL